MSNYNNLKTTIDANIKQNGNQEITGPILNSVLNQMVNILGTGYQFAGVATLTPATDPGTPDAKVFYIANGKGTYTNFGGLEVTEDEVVVLYWDTAWHKVATGIASQSKLSELDMKVNGGFDFLNEIGQIHGTIGGTGSAPIVKPTPSGNKIIRVYSIQKEETYHISISQKVEYAFAYALTNTFIGETPSESINLDGNAYQYSNGEIPVDDEITNEEYLYLLVSYYMPSGVPSVSIKRNGVSDDVNEINSQVFNIFNLVNDSDRTKELPYEKLSGKGFLNTNVKGETIGFRDTDTNVFKIDVSSAIGYLYLTATSRPGNYINYSVVVTDKNDKIIDFITTNYYYVIPVLLDVRKYPSARYVYFSLFQNFTEHPPMLIADDIITRMEEYENLSSEKASVLLHFDGPDGIGTTHYNLRASLVKEYGFKCSFMISPNSLNSTLDDWASDTIRNEYWSLVNEGFDFAFYPNKRCDEFDAEGWDDFISRYIEAFARLGVHNITCFACGNLSINNDLLSACKKHNFKIIRGGGTGAENTYSYGLENIYINQLPTDETHLVVSSSMLSDNGAGTSSAISTIQVFKDNVDNAVRTKRAIAYFTHSVIDNNTNPANVSTDTMRQALQYLKDLSEQGKVQVVTFREFYSKVNKVDGHEWDYNRLVKMFHL